MYGMLKVVLVDDEQIILNGLIRVMPWAEHGCEVVATAADGWEGVEVVRRERPDILMTDIRMPNMSGLAMIAALKSEFPAMQITVLTAHRDFEYAQKALHLGVTRYLLKPSKMDELVEALAEMASRCASAAADSAGSSGDTGAADSAGSGGGTGAIGEAWQTSEASRYVLRQAVDYIRAHCTERLRLSDVADSVFVSQWHLSKLINRHTGQTFNDVLNMQRIERAKELLRQPRFKVHEIAERVGFSDVAHFSKTFKKIEGRSPAAFRAGK
jgi:YesN/AraC family two-component response regulator